MNGAFRNRQRQLWGRLRSALPLTLPKFGGSLRSRDWPSAVSLYWARGRGSQRSTSASPVLGYEEGKLVTGCGALRLSQHSISERSQPPQKCLGGNVPLLVQRNSVALWTPTTRTTSAVVIRWSKVAMRSVSCAALLSEDSRRRGGGGGAESPRGSCCGAPLPQLCDLIAFFLAATVRLRCPKTSAAHPESLQPTPLRPGVR